MCGQANSGPAEVVAKSVVLEHDSIRGEPALDRPQRHFRFLKVYCERPTITTIPPMKRITDFTSYANILPYDSEIFGVYQPMLGWRAKRMTHRWDRGFAVDKAAAFEALYKKFKSQFEIKLDARKSLARITELEPAQLRDAETRFGGSFVMESIAGSLPPLSEYDDSVWDRAIKPAAIKKTLDGVVIPRTQQWHTAATGRKTTDDGPVRGPEAVTGMVAEQLQRESAVAGFLMYLKDNQHFDELRDLFYRPDRNLARDRKSVV